MQTVRTTVNLPVELHQRLREQAFQEKKSLNRVIVQRIDGMGESGGADKGNQIQEALELFDRVAKSGKKIDLLKALREDRDRDGR